MPRNNDATLLESVTTHRRRLRQAFLLGKLSDRRQINDNVRRFIGGIVLAAVAGVGCLGYSFVTTTIAKQNAQQQQLDQQYGTVPSDAATPTPSPEAP